MSITRNFLAEENMNIRVTQTLEFSITGDGLENLIKEFLLKHNQVEQTDKIGTIQPITLVEPESPLL